MTDSDQEEELQRLLDEMRRSLSISSSFEPFATPVVELLRSSGVVAPQLAAGLVDLQRRLADLEVALAPYPTTSHLPLGRIYHRLMGRGVRRETSVLVRSVNECLTAIIVAVNSQLVALLESVNKNQRALLQAARVEATRTFVEMNRGTEMFITQVSAELAGAQQSINELSASVADHSTFVASQRFRPFFSNLDYGDRFRGSRDDILRRYHDVADVLVAAGGPVLDLGCGRGELIELIGTKGGSAKGVEMDPELVDYCRSILLDVHEQDALSALNHEADGSLGGVALIQVVEHLTAQELVDVVTLAFTKLRDGGLLVAETVNGTSPFVFTRSFYCDPTHSNPVHHEYLCFLLEQAGFARTEVTWRSPVEEDAKLAALDGEGAADPHDENATDRRFGQLNEFLFGAQDYLIVATK